MKRKAMITWFVIVFVICFTGIFASTIMIDNLIDSYIEEIKNTVNIEVINNTNDEVAVEDKNGNIKIYINSLFQMHFLPKYGIVPTGDRYVLYDE